MKGNDCSVWLVALVSDKFSPQPSLCITDLGLKKTHETNNNLKLE